MNDKRIFCKLLTIFVPVDHEALCTALFFAGQLLFGFFAFFYQTALPGSGNCLGTWNREQGKREASIFPKATIDRDPIKASFQTEADAMTQQMGARQSNCYMTN